MMYKSIYQLLKNPRLVFTRDNIFLFSHMRANTSLFGHILGSHPEIEGYYEMHIGYFSWKSLWRQKLLYLKDHTPKPTSHFFFDKLLHNYCVVENKLLTRPSTRAIFMLRAPEQTIKSIVGLYQKNQKDHEYAQVRHATRYYIDRLNELCITADRIPDKYFYLDAESLIDSPGDAFTDLQKFLCLSTPLKTEYSIFNKTGSQKAGDSSNKIKSGKIEKIKSDYTSIVIPEDLLTEARQTYAASRNRLRNSSQNKPFLDNRGRAD